MVRQKSVVEWGTDFLEIYLFLEDHALEFHEIWNENTLGNKQLPVEYWNKIEFNRAGELIRYSSESQQGIIL